MALRDYQQKIIDDVRDLYQGGHVSPLVVLSMGGGKTKTAMSMVHGAVSKGKTAVWLCHREELVQQASEEAFNYGIPHGIVAAKHKPVAAPFQICMIQTLMARGNAPKADFCIVDEAHRACADEYLPIVQQYPTRVGLTATPQRADGRAMGLAFDSMVLGPGVPDLIEDGHLVSCEVLRPPRVLGSGEIAQSPVDAYTEHCGGHDKCIVFATNVRSARSHLEEFTRIGIKAAILTGTTPYQERKRIIWDLKNGFIKVLINVYALVEGFNEPSVSSIILARGFQAASSYLQAAGRGLRAHPGKTDCLLVDLRGSSWLHGSPDEARDYSLDGVGIGQKGQAYRFCPVCSTPIPFAAEDCPACEWVKPETKLVTVVGERLEKYAAKRREDDGKRAKTLARYMFLARMKSYKPGWAFWKYKVVYGENPSTAIVQLAKRDLDSK